MFAFLMVILMEVELYLVLMVMLLLAGVIHKKLLVIIMQELIPTQILLNVLGVVLKTVYKFKSAQYNLAPFKNVLEGHDAVLGFFIESK